MEIEKETMEALNKARGEKFSEDEIDLMVSKDETQKEKI